MREINATSGRLLTRAREALSFQENQTVDAPDRSLEDDGVRHLDPTTVELDADLDDERYEDFSGTLSLIRVAQDSDFVVSFQHAVEDDDPETIQELHDRIVASAEEEAVPLESEADLLYDGEPVITGLGRDASSQIAADVISFDADVDPSAFEVREHVVDDDSEVEDGEPDVEYEFLVAVVPPQQTEAEADANDVAPDHVDEPSLNVQPSEMSAVTLVAAGALLGAAAVYGSGSGDVGLTELEDHALDSGASVDELVAAREDLLA